VGLFRVSESVECSSLSERLGLPEGLYRPNDAMGTNSPVGVAVTGTDKIHREMCSFFDDGKKPNFRPPPFFFCP